MEGVRSREDHLCITDFSASNGVAASTDGWIVIRIRCVVRGSDSGGFRTCASVAISHISAVVRAGAIADIGDSVGESEGLSEGVVGGDVELGFSAFDVKEELRIVVLEVVAGVVSESVAFEVGKDAAEGSVCTTFV